MNKVVKYGEKVHKNLILALGYFDAIHKGHVKVLQKTVALAKEKNAVASALIFTGGKGGKDLFTLFERSLKLFSIGIEVIIVKELSNEFMQTDKISFLKELSSLYCIDSVVSGSDFTFGKNALGNTQTLVDYFGKDKVFVTPLILSSGEKISTTAIKTALSCGNVMLANELLGSNYFISGEVVKGKGLGKTLSFPTANIPLSSNKFQIKEGVYLTFTIIDNTLYPSITNCGSQPTVNGNDYISETYIHGFSGNLYGKMLTVYFVEYIREVTKFNSLDELKTQLIKDLEKLL